jgi:hypothetical protein
MAKDQTVVFGSPFKFGFFAGLGFFFASLLMSILSFVVIALLGLGTIGSLISGSHAVQEKQSNDVKPVRWQVSDSR